MDSRPAPSGAGNSGGVGSGFSFFSHFSPLSSQQRQAAHEILPGLFLGSALAARSASWLHQNAITHILCLHNAAAAPAVLQQQLQEQQQQRREILRYNPEREPGQVQQQQRVLQQMQQRHLAHHLAVHPDRYVYCCCHAVDTPQALVLPLIPFCIDFIDKALNDRNYRLHAPDQRQLDAAAAAAASGTPQHNVRLLQSRRRNHCFIEKGETVDAYDIPGDALLRDSVEDGEAGGPETAPAGGEKKTVGGRVLVHCAKGISRSACIVLAYLMYRKCLRLEDALAFLSLKRPVYPNVGFQVQLHYLQERMEEIRPALPHAVGEDQEQQQQQQQQQQQKGAAAGAAAAHAFEAAVSIEKSEPDIFRRDPNARIRLRRFVATCSSELSQLELERRITERILKECTSVEEQVALLYRKAALLQQRSLWRPFGLFYENLRSYQLQQEEAVLKRAEEAGQKAAELKLVFAATLPGVSMADKVADEIKTWVADCRATAAEAAAAADAAAAAKAMTKAADVSKDKTLTAAVASSEFKGSGKSRDRSRRDREREERRSRRSTSRGSSSSRHSSTSSSERNHTENPRNNRTGSTQARGALPPASSSGKYHSSSKGRDRDRGRDKDRHRNRDRDRDSSSERRKRKRSRKDESKKKEKKQKKHSSLRLQLKTPKPKPEKRYSSDSE